MIEFLVPGDPETLTGGYLYDRRIVDGLRAQGRDVRVHRLPDAFPAVDASASRASAAAFDALPDGCIAVVDGLAFGALPELAARHAARLRWVALVHHPLALETGLGPEQAQRLADSERRALASARRVIATSAATARLLAADYAVPADRIDVVEPGTDAAPLARAGRLAPGERTLRLLCVATLTPRKGHRDLFEALAPLRGRDWRLHCIGSATRDAATAAALHARLRQLHLTDRVVLTGELSAARLAEHYRGADVFVLASLFEGYGMAFAEALAHGLPIVGTRAGAAAETVPRDAGLMVAPGDVAALSAALARVLDDAVVRAGLADAARAHRARLPDWPASAAAFLQSLDRAAS
ncbi:MAG: glycosyltransferase family 4 protein [Burkholderiaceae bacterium]